MSPHTYRVRNGMDVPTRSGILCQSGGVISPLESRLVQDRLIFETENCGQVYSTIRYCKLPFHGGDNQGPYNRPVLFVSLSAE